MNQYLNQYFLGRTRVSIEKNIGIRTRGRGRGHGPHRILKVHFGPLIFADSTQQTNNKWSHLYDFYTS